MVIRFRVCPITCLWRGEWIAGCRRAPPRAGQRSRKRWLRFQRKSQIPWGLSVVERKWEVTGSWASSLWDSVCPQREKLVLLSGSQGACVHVSGWQQQIWGLWKERPFVPCVCFWSSPPTSHEP